MLTVCEYTDGAAAIGTSKQAISQSLSSLRELEGELRAAKEEQLLLKEKLGRDLDQKEHLLRVARQVSSTLELDELFESQHFPIAAILLPVCW